MNVVMHARVTVGNARAVYRVIGVASSGRILLMSEATRRLRGPVDAATLHPVDG